MTTEAEHQDALRHKRWRVPELSLEKLSALVIGLLLLAYVAGWMVGQEQERDLQQAREQACEADPHCLRP